MQPEDLAWHWIETVERTPPESFRPVSDFAALPEPPMADSLAWCRTMFVPAASPHHPPNAARHGFHLADVDPGPADLLRHVNFVLIRAGAAQRKSMNATASALIALPWEGRRTSRGERPVRLPEPRGEDVLVSTNPDEHPVSALEWSDRIDAMVRRGAVYLLCYKRRSPTMGFRHDGQWFDDEFRQQAPASV
jgi:hypothetical protein